MLVTNGGQLIRTPVRDIRIAGRSTQGVIVFDTAEGERVVSVERLSEEGETNGNEGSSSPLRGRGGSTRACRRQYSDHLGVAARARMAERRDALAVGDVDVGAGLDQRRQGGGVILAAITEHDGFHQRGPAQIVDVIERRAGDDESANDLGMTEMGGGDQGGAVIGAGDSA